VDECKVRWVCGARAQLGAGGIVGDRDMRTVAVDAVSASGAVRSQEKASKQARQQHVIRIVQ
jgi:hypothetical protein